MVVCVFDVDSGSLLHRGNSLLKYMEGIPLSSGPVAVVEYLDIGNRYEISQFVAKKHQDGGYRASPSFGERRGFYLPKSDVKLPAFRQEGV